jgi:murein DD-endopeptidase MepM/ murein hydrolase activator NlpD
MPREDLVDPEVLSDQLSDQLGLVVNAYCLYVDGVYIGATPYEGALEQLLEQLTLSASDENTISCTFEEEIEIRQQYVAADDVMNLGHLAETLYSTKTAEVTYEVKKGDTWSQIANRHGLTSKELLALNPGYNVDKLQIGEMLTLSASVPYLTMTVMQREQYVDNVAFDIESTPTSDLYKGDYKVTSKGEYGLADVVANVTYVNGVETQRTILSSVTLKEPVTEYRLEGTKDRPTWHPTGTFRWPASGRITSYFGGRKSPGGIGSTNHKGMDIAGPRGTAIYASDGGIVTYAGWKGGYGYVVIINHNYNGYETFYAHNSKLLVSVGQKVYKGQQIAKMGSTGNSTGSHCHFEIRYNGVAKNPLNYLP